MFISDVKNKIDCCFAKQIYKVYLNNRFGIGACSTDDLTTIQDLDVLQKTFQHYYESMFPIDRQINTGNQIMQYEECNIANLIEKINLL